MTGGQIVLTVVGLVALGLVARALVIQFRRRQWLAMRLTEEQRKAVAADFRMFSRLPDSVREELEGLMHVFIHEKSFEACGGLEAVTGHMKRVIAAQACLLLVNRKHNHYRKLRSILLYPTAYRARDEYGEESVRLGESWQSGSVVLAWDSVIAGGHNGGDGHHVSLHEFAHQLDQDDGAADGVPELPTRGSYRAWSHAFSTAYGRFTRKVERGKRTAIGAASAPPSTNTEPPTPPSSSPWQQKRFTRSPNSSGKNTRMFTSNLKTTIESIR